MKMKLYYVTKVREEDWGDIPEYISGPYGTYLDACNELPESTTEVYRVMEQEIEVND